MTANDELFQGAARVWWERVARGYTPVVQTDRTVGFAADGRGVAIRNGGMQNVGEDKLRTGNFYYRFVDSACHSAPDAMGNWWIDFETMSKFRRFVASDIADKRQPPGDFELSNAVKYFFALPYEWGDHAKVIRGIAKSKLRCWVGEGRSAEVPLESKDQVAWRASIRASGKSVDDRATGGTRFLPPQHVKVYQILVPMDPAQAMLQFLDGVGKPALVSAALHAWWGTG